MAHTDAGWVLSEEVWELMDPNETFVIGHHLDAEKGHSVVLSTKNVMENFHQEVFVSPKFHSFYLLLFFGKPARISRYVYTFSPSTIILRLYF